MQFLRKGGFCYIDASNETVGMLVHSSHAMAQSLQFECPVAVPSQALEALEPRSFHAVRSVLQRRRGAKTYAWYPPSEKAAGFEIGGEHGAFVYRLQGNGPEAVMFAVQG